MYPLLDQYVLEQRTQEAEIYLASQQSKLQQKDIPSQMSIVYGPAVEGITKAAEREGAELIAMASHGRTGLARAFYGSVAAGVLHRVDRPLLLIRSLDTD
jgi:nucleotide-binding universal stress UspA family protein